MSNETSKTVKTGTPFDDSSFEIPNGNNPSLTIESSQDKIALYGSLDISASKEGLEKAGVLLGYLQGVVRHLELLEKISKLPDKEILIAPTIRANPFGNG